MTRSRVIATRNAQLANEITDTQLVKKHPQLEHELEEGEIYEPPKPLPAYTAPLFYSQADITKEVKTVTLRRHTRIRRNHRKRNQEELVKKYGITLSE